MKTTGAERQGAAAAKPGLPGRIDGGIALALAVLGATWIFGIMVLVCVDVLMRNALNAPISGVTEFIALSVPALVFLQLPMALSQHRLIRAELIIEALERQRPRLAAFLNGAFAAAGLFIFWKVLVWAWPDFVKAYQTGEFAGAQSAYTIPVWPFKLAMIIGVGFGGLQIAKQLAQRIADTIRPQPDRQAAQAPEGMLSVAVSAVFVAALIGFAFLLFFSDLRSFEIGVYGLAAMLALTLLGMPIPFVLMALSYFGIWAVRGGEDFAVNTLGLASSTAVSSYEFGVIPLFIMMGLVLERADVGRDAFRVAASLLRKVRGGLGMATVFANAIFASIVGSSIASAAVFSRIAVPQMVEHGYTKRFSLGCVAGSSVLGMLIPPSLLLIVYGLIAEESVGKLFIAAVIPGILLSMAFALSIYGMTFVMPGFVGRARSADDIEAASWREIASQLGPIAALVLAVVGGIYGGLFTPTEAAAVGSAFAFILAFAKRRIDLKGFREIVMETGAVSAVILFLIVAANIYARQVTLTGIPSKVSDWVAAAGLDMTGFLAVYLVVLLLLGMILDSVSIMLIVLPIMLPVLELLEGDKIWFGIVTVIAVEIGLLTPPFGLSVYVVKGVLPKDFATLPMIFAGAFPFVVIMLAVTIVLMTVPELSLWLLRL